MAHLWQKYKGDTVERVRQSRSHNSRPGRTSSCLPQPRLAPQLPPHRGTGSSFSRIRTGLCSWGDPEEEGYQNKQQPPLVSRAQMVLIVPLLHCSKPCPSSICRSSWLIWRQPTYFVLKGLGLASMFTSGLGCCTRPFTVKMGQGVPKGAQLSHLRSACVIPAPITFIMVKNYNLSAQQSGTGYVC